MNELDEPLIQFGIPQTHGVFNTVHSLIPPNIFFINLKSHNHLQPHSPQSLPASHAPLGNSFCVSSTAQDTVFSHDDPSSEEDESQNYTFDASVFLFNSRDYHKCHDYLEELWNKAEEPQRTLIHGILQCAVGFHHLFSNNHRGAMMELGEGLCKLKKMNFESGPFYEFEKEISASLDFVYQTQLELAACSEDLCLTMDGSEQSYQLLGSFGAGQQLYNLERDIDGISYIVFSPEYSLGKPTRVKVPSLRATKDHLMHLTK